LSLVFAAVIVLTAFVLAMAALGLME